MQQSARFGRTIDGGAHNGGSALHDTRIIGGGGGGVVVRAGEEGEVRLRAEGEAGRERELGWGREEKQGGGADGEGYYYVEAGGDLGEDDVRGGVCVSGKNRDTVRRRGRGESGSGGGGEKEG